MLNAFRRSHSIKGLEELSLIICIHLTLVASFPDHTAINHWKAELDGFAKTLERYSKGKGNRKNITSDIVALVLTETINDTDSQELIEAAIEAKGFASDKIDWLDVGDRAMIFAERF